MNSIKKLAALFVAMIAVTIANAQVTSTVAEPNDFMHSNGRIYVVVAVVLTILIGLFIYVYTLDRKITKLEQHK